MASPSIIPNDRLDKDFYLVLEEFRDGAAFRETDEGIDQSTLIEDLLTGQYDRGFASSPSTRSRAGRATRPKTLPASWSVI
ncbi:hypothetical protein [Bradyrhizobium sp. DASA03120]|uniref:hypothetical protein n=1 Tax=Bradyrhizobium sp. SMVTL-02 TaxID=3395917 RepID=UPI003F6E8271